METNTFRELLGFSRERFNFGSAMIVLAAFFIADWFFSAAYSLIRIFFAEGNKDVPISAEFIVRLVFDSFSNVTILSILPFFILGLLLALCFRFLPNDLLATLAAVIAFIPINALFEGTYFFIYEKYIFGNSEIRYEVIISLILADLVSSISPIIGVGLMYLLFKKPLPSIILGAVLGNILFFCYSFFSFLLRENKDFTLSIMSFRFVLGIVTGVILGVVWWFLLWLAENKTVPNEERKPFMSKQNYIGTLAASFLTIPFIVLTLFNRFLAVKYSYRVNAMDFLLFLVAVSLLILGAIAFYTFIYRIWSSIQDGHYARTTPAFAVGGLFIPLYNFYWIFQVLPGFTKDFNDYIKDLRINVPPLGSGLPLAWCILVIASAIPLIGILANLANIFVTLLIVSKVTDAVNAAQDFKANQIPPIANSLLQPVTIFN